LAIGVSNVNEVTSPPGATRWTWRAAASVYQAAPSVVIASPIGSRLVCGSVRRSSFPLRMRPIAFVKSMVNQTVPSGATAIAVGVSRGSSIENSTTSMRGESMIRHRQNAPASTTIAASAAATAYRRRR
jgi:hypothetical protein